ncbi:protein penguin [Vespa crabro]|uniref:protein penguin n=1 Tax=Vespa crabro TaxID=7445 RepID=UPI001F017C5D|nr:protein penguin [Vespa crabro]XP_046818872.1 protein penguin [Vespa crabro]XP_046818873.1 protein penguin [Vespa crabro]
MKRKEQGTSTERKPKRIKKNLNNDDTITEKVDLKVVKKEKKDKENNVKIEKKVKFEKPLLKNSLKIHQKDLKKKGYLKDLKNKKNITKDNILTTQKEDWQNFKKKKKDLREKRKERRLTDVYEISVRAKKISEKLRRTDCTLEEKKKLSQELHELLKSHYNKIIFTHDISRIVQWVLKYCESDIRNNVFDELKPSIIAMTQSKYAKNCIKVLLKHGTAILRKNIISEWYGNVVNLMSNIVSAPLIELAYSTWATNEDKINFKQEFYGDIYKKAKDKKVKILSDTFENAEGMKSAILSAVKTNVIRILNKKFINSVLLQTVIWEYLTNCSNVDRSEMIVMLRSLIVELSNTKVGTKVAMLCIWHGTNKDRKIIMKALKENIKNIAMSEHGYMVLLALIDSVDDTVLMKKIILSEIQKDLTEIVLNEYGKHVILYLVARRDPHYFPPSIIECLSQGDNNETSKKPADIREKELREAVTDLYLESIASETAEWLSKGSVLMVTLAVLKVGSGEKLKCVFKAIASFLTNTESECDLIEHPGLHMMLKKLIQNDKNLEAKEETTFGSILIDYLTKNILKQWIRFNRGCFLLILLIENETETVISNLILKLQAVLQNIKKEQTPGATILLKKLKEKQ